MLLIATSSVITLLEYVMMDRVKDDLYLHYNISVMKKNDHARNQAILSNIWKNRLDNNAYVVFILYIDTRWH